MSRFKMVFAASILFGLSSGAAMAIPLNNLAVVDTGVKAENVRWVCNPWGRCWWRPNYYGAYSYYAPRPYWRRHYHHWRGW